MTTYKIGDIFYDDKEYSARAEFCNNNNLMIVEIAPDEKGRRFQIQAVPPPSAVDLAYNEIYELQNELREAKYVWKGQTTSRKNSVVPRLLFV